MQSFSTYRGIQSSHKNACGARNIICPGLVHPPICKTIKCDKVNTQLIHVCKAAPPSNSKSVLEQNPRDTCCWLIGAGPGPVDFLTVKAARLIKDADIIIYDDLGTKEALSLAKDGAELVYVGKRGGQLSIKQADIDRILVERCNTGRRVVRLKGGCPSVFSRVRSEAEALRAAGVSFELVPGVSSVLAAPLFAGYPLTVPTGKKRSSLPGDSASQPTVPTTNRKAAEQPTDQQRKVDKEDTPAAGGASEPSCLPLSRVSSTPSLSSTSPPLPPPSSAFSVVSGHEVSSSNWASFRDTPTLVVLMGGRVLKDICRKLREEAGWGGDTPVAVIRSAGNPDQRVWQSDLDGVVFDTAGEKLSPCVLLFGQAAAAGGL